MAHHVHETHRVRGTRHELELTGRGPIHFGHSVEERGYGQHTAALELRLQGTGIKVMVSSETWASFVCMGPYPIRHRQDEVVWIDNEELLLRYGLSRGLAGHHGTAVKVTRPAPGSRRALFLLARGLHYHACKDLGARGSPRGYEIR